MAKYNFNCPLCGGLIKADDSYCGMEAECPHCDKSIIVPERPKIVLEKANISKGLFASFCSHLRCMLRSKLNLKRPFAIWWSVIAALFVFVIVLSIVSYSHSVENDNAEELFQLGKKYFNGESVDKDEEKAFSCFRKAADDGHVEAQYILGLVYCSGSGVEKDPMEGLRWVEKAAEKGNVNAQFHLAECYCRGEIVKTDYAKTAFWLNKAAEKGHVKAQYILGLFYCSGTGVDKDSVVGMKWLHKAAENGNAEAQFQIGKNYFNGEYVSKDEANAAFWIRKAAENGIANAQYAFGLMYKDGVGVRADRSDAIKWLRKAAEQGHQDAKDALAAFGSEQGDFEQGVRQGAQLLSLLLNLKEAQRQNEQVYNPRAGRSMKRSESERYDEVYNDERIRERSRDDYWSGVVIP